jgi:GLPGLI family protein
MKTFFLSVCLFLFQLQTNAQESYLISYEFGKLMIVDGQIFENPKDGFINLVFNDSLYYNYYSPRIPHLKNNQKLFGKSFGSHAYMFDVPKKMLFSAHNGRNFYATQLPDSMDMKPWIINKTSVYPCTDYECLSAYRVVGINDTMKIKYTAAIPYSFGPQYPGYTPGIPGAILEYYNLGTQFYYKARRIVKGNFTLVKPENYLLKLLSH